MQPAVVLLLGDDCVCEMHSRLWNDFWYGDIAISPVAGNARRGPHCIGIVFLCQEWRLWGLFFAGWSFVMKPVLPPIRQNVFLVVDHSAFLELLTLRRGPLCHFLSRRPCLDAMGDSEEHGVVHVLVACLSALVLAPLRSRNAPPAPRRPPAGVCYSLIAACRIFVAPPAALTPSKHTLHFAVTCVSRS